jgi:PAS domain S-box-containing protein
MLGYEDHEIENTFSAWEHLIHPDDRERARSQVQSYFEGKSATYELEHRLRHKDGTHRWILARGVALRDPEGRPLRMAGSHVDLTERKQAEERLRHAYAELAQSEETLRRTLADLEATNEELKVTQRQLIQAARLESVGTLAAGVAHEVKNPLQTILMGLDYLTPNLTRADENIALVLTDMREAVTRANTIIRGLLQLSAQSDFELKPEDLNATIRRALTLIKAQAIAAKISVVRKLEPAMPRIKIDRGKIEQVLINLFLNALQAMSPGGTLTVTTCCGRLGEDVKLQDGPFRQFAGERVAVGEVRDTGTGISPVHLPKVFEPFYTTKPPGVGTGLGLSVVKKILDLHGAGIEIRNAPDRGVVVTLVFRAPPE